MERHHEGRWLGTSPCDNERSIALRTNALRANERSSALIAVSGRFTTYLFNRHRSGVGCVLIFYVVILTSCTVSLFT